MILRSFSKISTQICNHMAIEVPCFGNSNFLSQTYLFPWNIISPKKWSVSMRFIWSSFLELGTDPQSSSFVRVFRNFPFFSRTDRTDSALNSCRDSFWSLFATFSSWLSANSRLRSIKLRMIRRGPTSVISIIVRSSALKSHNEISLTRLSKKI